MTVTTIDAHYFGFEGFAATYLMQEGDRAAFIETATARSVPRMLETLAAAGLQPQDVEYVIITHVHLDHAGGAAALLQACPNATLLAHPRAARHAIDPSKLVASAEQVYGVDKFAELYGTIDPIDAARVRTMDDEEELAFGDRTLRFLHTRGHANHHFCIWDSATRGVFTGDSFGLVYPVLQSNGLFTLPSTSPTDFDAVAAKESLHRIVRLGAERAYLTHFGEVTDLAGVASRLEHQLDGYEAIVTEAFAGDAEDAELDRFCAERVDAIFAEALAKVGLAEDKAAAAILKTDRALNAQGVAFAVRKLRHKAKKASG
ncbi:MAG: MBL fold metallo-hydrolase [Myxococcota bacterium]